jgi:hypothetical protein
VFLFFIERNRLRRQRKNTMDPFRVSPQNLYLLNNAASVLRGPQPPAQQPPAQQPPSIPLSDVAYNLPANGQSQAQTDEAHNMAVAYSWSEQKKWGFDPIESEGPPGCFNRDRRVACGKIFNMNSDTAITIVSHLLNAFGTVGVALTIAFEVMWMFNGKGASDRDFTWLMTDRTSPPNWWVPLPGLVGYACFFSVHVLYLIGGATIPSVFLLICDLGGVGGGLVLEVSANNATNRMIGVAMTMGAAPFIAMIAFIILIARDPRYTYPPPPPAAVGPMTTMMTPQQAALAPRAAGIPFYPQAGPYGQFMMSSAGYAPMPVSTGKRGRKSKS